MEWIASNEPCRRPHYGQPRHKPPAGPCKTTELTPHMKNILRPIAKKKKDNTFHRHVHHDIYYHDHVRVHGKGVADEIKRLSEADEKANPPPKASVPPWKPGPEHYEHPAIQKLQEDYYQKCKSPPIEVRLLAYKTAGYPEHWLMRMLKSHDKRVKAQPEIDAWFDLIMGPYANKKESVPKPKTLKQIFKIKTTKVIMPDEDDEEAPAVTEE